MSLNLDVFFLQKTFEVTSRSLQDTLLVPSQRLRSVFAITCLTALPHSHESLSPGVGGRRVSDNVRLAQDFSVQPDAHEVVTYSILYPNSWMFLKIHHTHLAKRKL